MKKSLLFLILGMIYLHMKGIVFSMPNHIPGYSVNVMNMDDGLRVIYTFDSIAQIPDQVISGHFNLRIAGFGNSSEETKPALPILLDRFAIPTDYSTYAITVHSTSYSEYYIPLAPARPMLPENSPYTFFTVPVKPLTIIDSYLPSTQVTDCGPQIFRRKQVANIQISPVAYNSARNKVRIYNEICFDISFIGTGTNTPDEGNDLNNDYCFKAITLQPDEASTANKAKAGSLNFMQSTPAEIDYLILTAGIHQPAALNFANWKRQLGYNVTLLSQSSWSKNAIINEIHSWYNSSKSPRYVLLLGDATLVTPYNNNPAPTDFRYSCMDGDNDIIPDFSIGRIPASTLDEAGNAISKIISYEANPLGNLTETKAVYCTYFQDDATYHPETDENKGYEGPDNMEDSDYARTTELIYKAFPTRFDSQQRIYYCKPHVIPKYWSPMFSTALPVPEELRKPGFAWDGDKADIITSINNGCTLFYHRDHGEYNGWSAPSFKTTDLNSLKNTTYPIVLSIDCLTGCYTASNNFAKKMLCMPDAGCATIVAASRYTYPGLNDAMVCAMFGSMFPEEHFSYDGRKIVGNVSLFTGSASSVGEMLNIGLINMERLCPDSIKEIGACHDQRNLYQCLGDPSLAVCWNSSNELARNTSITEFGGYITVETGSTSTYISFLDTTTNKHCRVRGSYATFETSDPDKVLISVSRPGWVPLIGSYSQINTSGADNPKDNYINSYELIGNTLLVYITMNADVSFGISNTWKLNAYLQSGARVVLISSVKEPPQGSPAVIQLPEIKNGDIVRLTLTCGNTIIDKKAILIRK